MNNLSARHNQTIKAQNLDILLLQEANIGLADLEKKSLKRLDDIPPYFWSGVYMGTSGGKDSGAIHFLMSRSKYGVPAMVHTNKPGVTHPKTLEFLYAAPYSVAYWPKGLILPGYYATQIDGSRASEFNREDGRSTDVVVGGVSVSRNNMPLYVVNGLFGRNFIFPIYDWTDAQVWAYTFLHDIPYSDEYLEPVIGEAKKPSYSSTLFTAMINLTSKVLGTNRDRL